MVEEGTAKSTAEGFWDDPKEAEKFLKQLSGIKYWVNALDGLSSGVEDLQVLFEMTAEMPDEDSERELEREFAALVSRIEEVEAKSMLGEEGDNLGALLKINSGAGGTESNDWSSMLLRM